MTYIWYRGSIKIWEEKLWCLSFNGAYVKVGGCLRVKYGGIWMGSDWWDNLYLITKTIWDNLNSRNIIIMGQKCTRVQDTDQNFQLWSVAMANPNRGRTIWDFSKFCTDRTFLVHLFFFLKARSILLVAQWGNAEDYEQNSTRMEDIYD